MSRNKNISDHVLVKVARYITPLVIGIQSPILGSVITGIDSFIISKMLKGWHPIFFLDDRLSKKVNNVIDIHNKKEKRKKIEALSGHKIDKDDLCPCNSGKKFKDCCGK